MIEAAYREELDFFNKIDASDPEWDFERGISTGVIQALEYVLMWHSHTNQFKGANNDTIKRAQDKLRSELGFGEKHS